MPLGHFGRGVHPLETNVFANGELSAADAELAPSRPAVLYEISGTSMATPFVAAPWRCSSPSTRRCAGRGEIDPHPNASQMPGFSEFEVGAGYVNVYAAVDKAFHRKTTALWHLRRSAGPPALQPWRSRRTPWRSSLFHIDYNPAATPGPGSANATTFTGPGRHLGARRLRSHIDDASGDGNGNTVGLLLTDPHGKVYSSGIALPSSTPPNREVVVANPAPGSWRLEVRGVRGLTSLPEVRSPPRGRRSPGRSTARSPRKVTTLPAIADVQGIRRRPRSSFVLKNG